MLPRTLQPVIFASRWGRQMRFLAGPRQSGKTTLARHFLNGRGDSAFYYNWDDRDLKLRYARGADFIREELLKGATRRLKRWVCYDEIHKMPQWKNILKAHFDRYEGRVSFIVTGSARLDFFRRSGDSLAGRYFLFHLFPFSLFEVTRSQRETLEPPSSAKRFIESRLRAHRRSSHEILEALLAFGGFPEPFLKADSRFHHLWHRNFLDRLIREDIRDLTKIGALENVATLVALLPERIGSPLSVNALRTDIQVSHQTVQNYLQALRLCYFLFEIPAYSKKINRTLRKEKKVYFHDWSFATDPAKRFENYVAAELLNWTTGWRDAGLGDFQLFYIRTRDGRECDFLIVRDGAPWLMAEAKLQAQKTASHHFHFARQLGGIPIIQIVLQADVLRVGKQGDFCASASRFLSA